MSSGQQINNTMRQTLGVGLGAFWVALVAYLCVTCTSSERRAAARDAACEKLRKERSELYTQRRQSQARWQIAYDSLDMQYAARCDSIFRNFVLPARDMAMDRAYIDYMNKKWKMQEQQEAESVIYEARLNQINAVLKKTIQQGK